MILIFMDESTMEMVIAENEIVVRVKVVYISAGHDRVCEYRIIGLINSN